MSNLPSGAANTVLWEFGNMVHSSQADTLQSRHSDQTALPRCLDKEEMRELIFEEDVSKLDNTRSLWVIESIEIH